MAIIYVYSETFIYLSFELNNILCVFSYNFLFINYSPVKLDKKSSKFRTNSQTAKLGHTTVSLSHLTNRRTKRPGTLGVTPTPSLKGSSLLSRVLLITRQWFNLQYKMHITKIKHQTIYHKIHILLIRIFRGK